MDLTRLPAHGWPLAVSEAEDEEGEDDLQAESPGDGAPADALAVGGAEPGGEKDGENSQHSGESNQEVAPLGSKPLERLSITLQHPASRLRRFRE